MENAILDITNQAMAAVGGIRAMLPGLLSRLLVAALLIAAGVLLMKLGRRVIRRAFRRAEGDPKLQNTRSTKTMHSLAESIFSFVCYFAIIMAALSAMGVDVSSLLTVAGIGGVAISFGCQTLVKDMISGLFLWVEGKMSVGDIVSVGGQTGTVESVAIRTTTLRGTNGNLYTIPNGDIRTVINMSRDYRYALVDITVAHGQDLDHVLDILRDEMHHVDELLDQIDDPPMVIGVIATDGRAATVRIECKCSVSDAFTVENTVRLRALQRFNSEGIRP